jgi:pimeloyl-ACP methyl ester carboxylesterase
MTTTYDEFGLYPENAAELGIPYSPPTVERIQADVGNGQTISALRFGTGAPEIVLLHGGAQNAHTWDSVVLVLEQHQPGRSVLAVDLPGHGHSSHRDDHLYWPPENAAAVERALRIWDVQPKVLVGMSLGGLTAIALSHRAPDLAPRLVLVDVTPGVNHEKASTIAQFINGPEYFESFDEILQRTIQFNPTRSESSLRRGVLHNAVEDTDGRWRWRYDLPRIGSGEGESGRIIPGLDEAWEAIGSRRGPLLLVRGALSPVVDDADVAELERRKPDAKVIVVDGAGHSVQGDQPQRLAEILGAEIDAAS